MGEPKLSISLRQMSNGKWRWQAHDACARLGNFSTGEYLLGGSIYGSDAIDHDNASDATNAAVEWWTAKGKPHSLEREAEIQRKRAQIKQHGRWWPKGQGPDDKEPS